MLRYQVISGLDQHDLLHVKVRHSDPPQQPQCLCSQLLSAGFLLCLRRGWLWAGHSQHWSSSSSCFLFSIKNYISVLQANMKVHSQGCMEAVSFYMRDNITTLVGLIVATLFIQVTGEFYHFSQLGGQGNNLLICFFLLQFVGFVFSFCLANSIKKECEIVWISVFPACYSRAELCPQFNWWSLSKIIFSRVKILN